MGVGLGDEITTAALDGTNYYNFSSGFRFVHYHNTFLQIMVERGLVGLLTFLGTLIWGSQGGPQTHLWPQGPALPRVGAIAGLVGMLVCGMGDYIWYYPRAMMLFWFVFGILVAAARLAKQEADLTPRRKGAYPMKLSNLWKGKGSHPLVRGLPAQKGQRLRLRGHRRGERSPSSSPTL